MPEAIKELHADYGINSYICNRGSYQILALCNRVTTHGQSKYTYQTLKLPFAVNIIECGKKVYLILLDGFTFGVIQQDRYRVYGATLRKQKIEKKGEMMNELGCVNLVVSSQFI
jgi:hypothetical protein